MCTTCGCQHDHSDHTNEHSPADASPTPQTIAVQTDILSRNDQQARLNRDWLAQRRLFALNFVSSPGSGKTELLCATIHDSPEPDDPIYVIEGDQQTDNDARRIRHTGAPAVQINTGKGCHLEADRVFDALVTLDPAPGSLVFIENVGNLVCPAEFDLGEAHKVVVISVTEGEDKPLKYPDMFMAADLMIINKIDLLPYVSFNCDICEENARRVHPDIRCLRVSSTTHEGMSAWWAWLTVQRRLAQLGADR